MKKTFRGNDPAARMLPLVRAIGREVAERARRITELEREISHCRPGPASRIQDLESDWRLERRELRRIEGELAELGCRLDAGIPVRIVGQGGWAYEERPPRPQ